MKLPDRFQMRLNTYPGWTHKVKKNEHGDYEVSWARGFPSKIGSLPSVVWTEDLVANAVAAYRWEIVDDTPNAEEKRATQLPYEFYFEHADNSCGGKVVKSVDNIGWYVTWDGDTDSHFYPYHTIPRFTESGLWRMLSKKPLTAEQEATIKTYREQIAALDSSIKINEQTINHHQILISSYKDRQNVLHEKISELTGGDSPSVAKAKEMKAELGKLKKGNV